MNKQLELTLPSQDGRVIVVGIDPGTNNLGYAKLVIESKTLEIVEVEARTLKAKKLPTYNKLMSKVCPDTTTRVYAYKLYLTELFKEDKPDLVASESPFFFRMNPGAYGPLVEIFSAIRESLWLYSQTLSLEAIAPKKVKVSVGASANATKDEMKLTLSKYGLPVEEGYIESLDEHSVDAIAVALTAYLNNFTKQEE